MKNLNKNSFYPFFLKVGNQIKVIAYWGYQFDLFSKTIQEEREYDRLSNSYRDVISQFEEIKHCF